MSRKAAFAKKIRWLKQVILLSGSLNFVFIVIFSYFLVRASPFPCAFEYIPSPLKPEAATRYSNIELMRQLAKLAPEELVEKLKDNADAEEGYRVRDLALALLVRRDHFDLPRSLGRRNLSARLIKVKEATLALYPGLTDDDFSKIVTFYEQERWPQTPKGLFLLLAKEKMRADPTLLQACALTNEFLAVEALFKGVKAQIKKKWLLALLSEGKWDWLSRYLASQKAVFVVTDEKRRELLLTYLRGGSQTAASLLLLCDYDYCLKRLDDASVVKILDVLPASSKRADVFAKQLQAGARGDLVQQKAKNRLVKNT